jgi:hypothetical protein
MDITFPPPILSNKKTLQQCAEQCGEFGAKYFQFAQDGNGRCNNNGNVDQKKCDCACSFKLLAADHCYPVGKNQPDGQPNQGHYRLYQNNWADDKDWEYKLNRANFACKRGNTMQGRRTLESCSVRCRKLGTRFFEFANRACDAQGFGTASDRKCDCWCHETSANKRLCEGYVKSDVSVYEQKWKSDWASGFTDADAQEVEMLETSSSIASQEEDATAEKAAAEEAAAEAEKAEAEQAPTATEGEAAAAAEAEQAPHVAQDRQEGRAAAALQGEATFSSVRHEKK